MSSRIMTEQNCSHQKQINTLFFDSNENKHGFYRGEDSTEKFCENLKEHGTEIISCKKRNANSEKKRKNHIRNRNFLIYAKKKLMKS